MAYRRSITDLDTNTVVEEDDFNTTDVIDTTSSNIIDNSSYNSSNNITTHGVQTCLIRSPKKRPFPNAQDDYYNLTSSNSPKRLKL